MQVDWHELLVVSGDSFWLRHKPGDDGVNLLCCALCLCVKFFLGYFYLYTRSFWSFLVSTVCHKNNRTTQERRKLSCGYEYMKNKRFLLQKQDVA